MSSGLVLRDYQMEGVTDIRGHMARRKNRVLYQLPTGGGKSAIFSHVGHGTWKRGNSFRVWVHRHELMLQAIKNLATVGIQPAIALETEGWEMAPACVGKVQGASRAIANGLVLPPVSLTIWDEAHHTAAKQWDTVFAQESAYHLGVTATPQRLDGKGLDDHYQVMVNGPGTKWLIDQGFLADIDPWADPKAEVVGTRYIDRSAPREHVDKMLGGHVSACIDAWVKKAAGLQTIWFCGSRPMGLYTVERLVSAGISAGFIDSYLLPHERRDVFRSYEDQAIKVLVAVDLIDEGIDVPETACIVLAVRTDSITRHFQRIGRGMRPKADGKAMVLLDMARNVLGVKGKPALGLPTDVVRWSLQGKPEKETEQKEQVTAAERDIKIAARGSDQLSRIEKALKVGMTFMQAMRFMQAPEDGIHAKEVCRTTKGKPYSWAFIIPAIGNKFWPDAPWETRLERSAKALGRTGYLHAQRAHGSPWTVQGAYRRTW